MMNSNRLRQLVSLSIISRALAQISNVTTCVDDYQWSINSKGQTPCLVAAWLESSCSGTSHSVNSIPPNSHYTGPAPEFADLCSCNSVTYSLIEACGGCQGESQILPYANWTVNCVNTVAIGQFPTQYPSQVEVPSWATLNISLTDNSFNPIAAEQEALKALTSTFSSSASSTPASTQASQTSSLGSSSPTPTVAPASSRSSGLSSGGIAGVTIAALVAVIGVLLLLFWTRLRRRQNSRRSPLDEPTTLKHARLDSASTPFNHMHSRSLSDPTSVISPFVYSASSIGPRPSSPGASTYYTTAPVQTPVTEAFSPQTPLATNPGTMPTQRPPSPPPGYTGAPEISV